MAREHAAPLTRRTPATLVVVGRLVLALFAYLTVLALLAGGLYFVGLLIGSGPTWALSLVGLAIAEGGALGVVLLIWRVVDRRNLVEMGLARGQAVRQWLRGAGVAALMMGFIVLVFYRLLNDASFSINPDPARATLALLAGFVGFAVQGPAEEVLFRGYVLENVRARWGSWWGVAISSVTFSLLHAANPGYGVLPCINLVLFGLVMALYKLRWDGGQLWGVFAMHTIWNWLQEVVFGLPNSGQAAAAESTLFHAQLNTALPDVIWGGGFGPEGTLGATLVLAALLWATLRSQPR